MHTPEAQARQNIDELLTAAGWVVQDYACRNLGAARGVAIREFPLTTGAADYLLLVDRRPIGVVEATLERGNVGTRERWNRVRRGVLLAGRIAACDEDADEKVK